MSSSTRWVFHFRIKSRRENRSEFSNLPPMISSQKRFSHAENKASRCRLASGSRMNSNRSLPLSSTKLPPNRSIPTSSGRFTTNTSIVRKITRSSCGQSAFSSDGTGECKTGAFSETSPKTAPAKTTLCPSPGRARQRFYLGPYSGLSLFFMKSTVCSSPSRNPTMGSCHSSSCAFPISACECRTSPGRGSS